MKSKLDKILILFLIIRSMLIAQSNMFSSGSNRPRANAGPNIKIIPEENIILDASRSFIRDGSKLKFEWVLSPGLALKNGNEFENEISTDFYKNKYLKSVQTYKKVIEIIPIENKPGTKLEVVLKVKDRIGFEDLDTLFVENIKDPNIQEISKDIEVVESPQNISEINQVIIDSVELNKVEIVDEDVIIDSSQMTSGILIESIKGNQLEMLDVKIINSIMVDQIKLIGYENKIIYDNNIKTESIDLDYNIECVTDSCFAENGRKLKVDYILLWNISESGENISIRLFKPKNSKNIIETYSISNPLVYITESGVYGLDFEIRKAIDYIFYQKLLYKNISRSGKIHRWNKRFVKVGKYPFLLGISYLFIDKIFFDNPEQESIIKPPGFPHDDS